MNSNIILHANKYWPHQLRDGNKRWRKSLLPAIRENYNLSVVNNKRSSTLDNNVIDGEIISERLRNKGFFKTKFSNIKESFSRNKGRYRMKDGKIIQDNAYVNVSNKSSVSNISNDSLSKKTMSGKKKALIALAAVGAATAIVGGIYAYKKHKQKKDMNKQEEKQSTSTGYGNPYHGQGGLFTSKDKAITITHGIKFVEQFSNNSIDSLMHFGIKGQKWGIRRFQNPDGSLTDEGKKEYMKDSKRSGGNKGAIAGMAIGGLAAAGLIAKRIITKQTLTGKTITNSQKKFRPIRDGQKIMYAMAATGILGMKIGKLFGKRKGEKELAEYGKKYVTQKVYPKQKQTTTKVGNGSSSTQKKSTKSTKK